MSQDQERRTILVVDDDKKILGVLKYALTSGDQDIVIFDDPAAAIRFIETNPPSLILSDLRMSTMSGIEMIKNIKEDKAFRDIPCVLLTADNFMPSGYEEELKIVEVIYKPFNKNTLSDHLNKIMDENPVKFSNTHKRKKNIICLAKESCFTKTIEDEVQRKGYNIRTEEGIHQFISVIDTEIVEAVIIDPGVAQGSKVPMDQLIERTNPVNESGVLPPILLIAGDDKTNIESFQTAGTRGTLPYKANGDDIVRAINLAIAKSATSIIADMVAKRKK